MNSVKLYKLLEDVKESLENKLYRDSRIHWETFIFPKNETHLSPEAYYGVTHGKDDQELLDRVTIAMLEMEE